MPLLWGNEIMVDVHRDEVQALRLKLAETQTELATLKIRFAALSSSQGQDSPIDGESRQDRERPSSIDDIPAWCGRRRNANQTHQ